MFRSVCCAVALATAAVPASAQDAELSKLREALRQLQQQVQQLEKRLQEAESKSSEASDGHTGCGPGVEPPAVGERAQPGHLRDSQRRLRQSVEGSEHVSHQRLRADAGRSVARQARFQPWRVRARRHGERRPRVPGNADRFDLTRQQFHRCRGATSDARPSKGSPSRPAASSPLSDIRTRSMRMPGTSPTPLAMKAFLGNQLNEDGQQVGRPTDLYVDVGVEFGQGEHSCTERNRTASAPATSYPPRRRHRNELCLAGGPLT